MYVFATKSAAVATGNNIPVTVCAGEVWYADDPLVAKYPALFSDTPESPCSTVKRDPAPVKADKVKAVPRRTRRA